MERNINLWLPWSCGPYSGPGPQRRHVPWLGIEPATLWFSGQHSVHWAIPARARMPFMNTRYGLCCMDCVHLTSFHSIRFFPSHSTFKTIFKTDFIYLFTFRERGREGEGEGEKHQCVVASHMPPPGDLACNPGLCTGWESNWWPFGSQGYAQSTELHQPGHHFQCYIKLTYCFNSLNTWLGSGSYLIDTICWFVGWMDKYTKGQIANLTI